MTTISNAQPRLSTTKSFQKMAQILGISVLGIAAVVMTANHTYAADGLAGADKSFLTNAAELGHAEVKASQLAVQKSSDPDVKTFAQKMIDGHSKVGDDLKTLATLKNVAVPDDSSVVQKAKILVLSNLEGHTFDKQYVEMIGVSAHKDAVSLFKKTAANTKDADIKQFAATNLPALQDHLQMAMQLKSTVDAKK